MYIKDTYLARSQLFYWLNCCFNRFREKDENIKENDREKRERKKGREGGRDQRERDERDREVKGIKR